MEGTKLRSSYIIAFVKFFFFLIFFCFMIVITKNFVKGLRALPEFQTVVFYLGILSTFIFYIFIADLDGVYEKIQHFFFRNSTFNLVVPSLLILLTLGYFVIPKLFKFAFDKNSFLFLGSVLFIVHLIFVARQIRNPSFIGFINYVFLFSLLYILTLFLLGLYLRVGYNIHLVRVLILSFKESFSIVKDIFGQLTT